MSGEGARDVLAIELHKSHKLRQRIDLYGSSESNSTRQQ